MNNDNNNLNGVVLGNVSNETPGIQSVNSGDSVMMGNPNNVVMPENNAINPEPQPANTVVMPGNVENIQPIVNPGPVGQTVVNPTIQPAPSQPTNTVVMPGNVGNAQPTVNPGPVEQTVVNPTIQPAPTQEIKPQPAFTNVNSINPMPGFEKNIGTNPPISLENDKTPKKKGNSTLFIVVVVLLLLMVALGTYYVLNYTDLLNKKETITVTTNNLIYNIGEKLSDNIEDYATIKGTNSSNCTFNITNVDNTKEGIYKYSVTCSNITKEGNITIIDDRELVIETQTVYHINGEKVDAKEFVKNPQEKVEYSFVNENEVNDIINGEVGSYTTKIKAVAENGKEVTADVKLVITQYKIKGYISCSSQEQTVDNYVMEKTAKFAIIEDGNNGFGNIGFNIYTFKYNSAEDYQKVVDGYSTGGNITINEITGVPEFDADNNKIVITEEADSTVLYSTYGADNLKDYSTIRTYFTQSLNYNCSYEKANA